MAGYALPGFLALAAALAGACLYSLVRRQRAAERSQALSDQALYEAGRQSAEQDKAVRLSRLASLLHEAGVEGPALRWVRDAAALVVVAMTATSALSANVLLACAAGGAVVLGLAMRLEALRRRRRALFADQLVRTLPQVSASVRSSLTFERALRFAAAHAEDPLQEELARVLADAAYGAALSEAFDRMAARTGSPDARALAAALRMQERFGGSIASVLDLIAEHARARMRMQRELRTELAGTRLATCFVASAMPALFMLMCLTNADFVRFYKEDPLGWAILGAAAGMEALGLFACKRVTALSRKIGVKVRRMG